MKRALFAVVVALALVVVPHSATATVSPAVQCADPVVLTGRQDGVAFPPHWRVNQDVWAGVGQQRMEVCDQTDWTAVARQNPSPLQVTAYPASERTYTDWDKCSSQPRLDSFTTLKSSYSHVSPPPSQWASFNWTWDWFLNGSICDENLTEVMLFSDVRNVDLPAAQLHPTIDGINYDLYYKLNAFGPGGHYIQLRLAEQNTAGVTNWKHVFKRLIRLKLLKPSDTLVFARYGAEVLTTRGKDVPFSLNGFTVTDAFS